MGSEQSERFTTCKLEAIQDVPGLREARPLLDAVAHAVVLQDAQGVVIYANEAAQRILGLSLDQLQGLTSMDPRWRSIHEDGSPYPGTEHPAMISLKTGQSVEASIMGVFNPHLGETRWIEIWSRPLFREGESKPFQAMATFIDRTEQKRVQDALAQSLEHLDYAHHAARSGSWEWEIDSGGSTWSPSLIQLFGLEPGRVQASHEAWKQMVHPEDREVALQIIACSLATGSDIEMEFRIIRPDGEVRWLLSRARAVKDGSGKVLRYLGIAMDITERKRSELRLQESEARFRVAFENAPLLMGIAELESGRHVYINETFVKLTGFTREDILGRRSDEVGWLKNEDRALIRRKLQDEGAVVGLELDMNNRKGEVLNILFNGSVFEMEGRRYLLASAQDVTARKKSERLLQETLQISRDLVQALPVGLFLYKVDETERRLTLVSGNPEAERLTGLKLDAWVGRDFNDLWPTARETGITEHFWNAYAENRVYETEDLSYQDDRLAGAFRVRVFRLPHELLVVAFENITERKRAQELVRRQAEELDSFFQTNLDLLCLASLDGTFLKLNPEWERCLGYPLQELEGRRFLDLVHPEDLPATMDALEKLGDRQDVTHFVNRYRCKDGSYRSIEWRSVPKGHIIYAAARDITERLANEEARLNLEHRLHQSQKLESLGSLAGGVAHDINNVLGAILNLASALRSTASSADPVAQAMDTMIKACTRGRDVVKSLLVFARKGMQEKSALDLNQMIKDLAHLLRHSTFQRVDIRLQLQEGLPSVMGDGSTLSHAIMNVCVNAVDAMPDGGVLTLETSQSPEGGARIQIRDTGCGMEASVLEKATEPFFTTKDVGKGTGLGLSMVYGAMEAHGGNLKLESQPGVGTTVTLEFPGMEGWAPASASLEQQRVQALQIQKHRILLVDDDELILESTLLLLEHLGHQVELAQSGALALKTLDQGFEPDLVILDMNMPGQTGAEVLPLLRERKPEVPILIATGFNDGKVDDLLARYPKVSSLSKPYTLDEIRQALQKV